jgi:uncharacterized BrkB/YihY/UPF0761 family membrane protein
VLTAAVAQAHRAGAGHRSIALWLGLVAAIVTGTTLLGQFGRAMNRIYGIEKDRPTLRKYGNAFVLLCSAGALTGLGFACVALGRVISTSVNDDLWAKVWDVARWPIGLLLITAAMALILRRAPDRHQPAWSWLSLGALLSVALWIVLTAGSLCSSASATHLARPMAHWRGSSLFSCGRTARPWPFSSGCPSPPSWKPFVRGPDPSKRAEGRPGPAPP